MFLKCRKCETEIRDPLSAIKKKIENRRKILKIKAHPKKKKKAGRLRNFKNPASRACFGQAGGH